MHESLFYQDSVYSSLVCLGFFLGMLVYSYSQNPYQWAVGLLIKYKASGCILDELQVLSGGQASPRQSYNREITRD